MLQKNDDIKFDSDKILWSLILFLLQKRKVKTSNSFLTACNKIAEIFLHFYAYTTKIKV